MFYAYEATVKVLVVENNLNDVAANKCEFYDTLEDIPFNQYDYWSLPDNITREDMRHRIKEPPVMELEKSRKGRVKESTQSRLTPDENKYGVLTEA